MLVTQKIVEIGHDLVEQMSDARRRSDELFQLVRTESLYERPIPERNRIIFYLGHLEAFDWNLLHESALGLRAFDRELDRLFAFGIDPVEGGLPTDKSSDWPKREIVQQYVRRVRAAIDEKLLVGAADMSEPTRDGFAVGTLLNVAIEHRLMHVETLAYMLHQLPSDCKIPPASLKPLSLDSNPVVARMVEIASGPIVLGLQRESEQFGWDNEYEAHTVQVPVFEIDAYKVTNQQYLQFVDDGGYNASEFWSADDWNWKTAQQISHPVFWKRANGQWIYRGMFQEVPLPPNWPVYVSHAEAMAYSRWAGKSLPTEEQWQRAAYGSADGISSPYPWGKTGPSSKVGNFDFQDWDPVPVNASPLGKSGLGVHDIVGNGWEWTSTIFAPFQGFEPFPFYRGYSADFFDGKHFVMKGGSARTAARMLRPSFRNWFQAHYQYMYAGFRCVKSNTF